MHQGQSASNRKCVYKWGSYFYCLYHFRGVDHLTLSVSLSLPHAPYFLERPLAFPHLVFVRSFFHPAFDRWPPKAQKLAFRSSPLRAQETHVGLSCPGFPASDTLSQGQLLAPYSTDLQLQADISHYTTCILLFWPSTKVRKRRATWISRAYASLLTDKYRVSFQVIDCINFESN